MEKKRILPETKMTLKMSRELHGYTQEKAAKLIGVSTDTLGNYERGKSYPDIPILRKIEEVYGITYDRIIFLPLDFGLTEKCHKKKGGTNKTINRKVEGARR